MPLDRNPVAPGLARSLTLGLALVGVLGVGAACADDPAPATPGTTAPETVIPWVKDWAAAQAQAKKENKDLLVDFTGSDWCGWCKRLEEEVFGHKSFLDQATKQFVFVFLDFPHAPELQKQVVDPALNEKLKTTYGVRGYPAIILATAEGLPYGQTGYQPGGPEAYLTHLAELRTGGDKIKTMIAKGKTDMASFKPGFEALVAANLLDFPDYAWVLAHAEAQDKDGSLGLKPVVEKVAEEKALREFLKDKRTKEEVDWAGVHALLKQSKHASGELLFQLSMYTGDWLLEQGRAAEAKETYLLPLRDPEIAANKRAKDIIDGKTASIDAASKPPEAPKASDAPTDTPK